MFKSYQFTLVLDSPNKQSAPHAAASSVRFGIENKTVAMAGGHTSEFSLGNMGPNESQHSKDVQDIKVEETRRD